MNWYKLLNLLPVVAGIANPTLGRIAQSLLDAGEEEVTKEMVATGKTREEILAAAAAGVQWEANIKAAEELAQLGHKN